MGPRHVLPCDEQLRRATRWTGALAVVTSIALFAGCPDATPGISGSGGATGSSTRSATVGAGAATTAVTTGNGAATTAATIGSGAGTTATTGSATTGTGSTGQPCSSDDDCPGMVCNFQLGTCQSPGPQGGPCERDAECAAGLCNLLLDQCQPPEPTGGPCERDAECAGGLCNLLLGSCQLPSRWTAPASATRSAPRGSATCCSISASPRAARRLLRARPGVRRGALQPGAEPVPAAAADGGPVRA